MYLHTYLDIHIYIYRPMYAYYLLCVVSMLPHSVLRAKALKRLVALRELLSSQEERQSTWRRVWHWLTRGLFSKKHEVDLAAAQGDPRKLAAASVNIVEGFME